MKALVLVASACLQHRARDGRKRRPAACESDQGRAFLAASARPGAFDAATARAAERRSRAVFAAAGSLRFVPGPAGRRDRARYDAVRLPAAVGEAGDVFKPLPAARREPGECGAVDAVLLESVILPDRRRSRCTPPATLRCTMAEAGARFGCARTWRRWRKNSARRCAGSTTSIPTNAAAAIGCRGATLSEHGRANALDVRAIQAR